MRALYILSPNITLIIIPKYLHILIMTTTSRSIAGLFISQIRNQRQKVESYFIVACGQ